VTYNEIVVNSETAFVKAAILQSDCANGVILNNTIDIEGPGKDTGLLFQNSSYGSDIRNNIIRGDNYCIGLVFNLSSPAQIQYNDVYRFSTLILGYPGLDSTNIYADPLFLGVVPDSIYYLTSHSPCIDTGDPEMLDPDGTRSDMGAYCYLHSSTGIDNEILPLQGYQLLSCYPNPTNNSTIISFVLNCSGTVEISVFDVNGRLVVEFLPGNLEMGQYKINWDLRDLASGIYFVNLVSLQGNEIQKLVVIK
jgi:hypothetical protein